MTKNTGRTPAIRIKSAIKRNTISKDASPALTLPPPVYKSDDYLVGGNLDPESASYSDFVLTPTQKEVEQINNLSLRLYVHGRIQYDDVFEIQHWMTFCTFLLPGGDFAICPKYNEMDNDQPNNLATKSN